MHASAHSQRAQCVAVLATGAKLRCWQLPWAVQSSTDPFHKLILLAELRHEHHSHGQIRHLSYHPWASCPVHSLDLGQAREEAYVGSRCKGGGRGGGHQAEDCTPPAEQQPWQRQAHRSSPQQSPGPRWASCPAAQAPCRAPKGDHEGQQLLRRQQGEGLSCTQLPLVQRVPVRCDVLLLPGQSHRLVPEVDLCRYASRLQVGWQSLILGAVRGKLQEHMQARQSAQTLRDLKRREAQLQVSCNCRFKVGGCGCTGAWIAGSAGTHGGAHRSHQTSDSAVNHIWQQPSPHSGRRAAIIRSGPSVPA